MQITLLPFLSATHNIEPQLLDNLVHDLKILGLASRIATTQEIPQAAYQPQRDQHRAEVFLEKLHPDRDEILLCVTACDLYAGDYNFVFGLAWPTHRTAIISIARLVYHGDAASHRERILKEAVHELGHVFGLGHCPNPNCVMHFSNTLADTDRKSSRFCTNCRRRLPAELFQLG